MSGYTVEVRTAILTGGHQIHAWLQITHPDGTKEAWGFYPETDNLGNFIYGPGDVRAETVGSDFSSTSGPLQMTEQQFLSLSSNIKSADATPPNYSLIALPGGIQCSIWAVNMLQSVNVIPTVISPSATPEFIPFVNTLIWNPIWQTLGFNIATSTAFAAASIYVTPVRLDPLVLDLDGDGIETLPINTTTPVMFDLNNSGVKKSVGWIKSDDGFLVMDRNGNGTIDTGAELFGDATPLSGGGTAADGFAALAQLDSNLDGQMTAADSAFANLRVWRDLNQNGLSEAGELSTLAELDITSINVAASSHIITVSNGNLITDQGSYTRGDGTVGSVGETANSADVQLATDPFRTTFTTPLTLTAQALTLPDMNGSAWAEAANDAVFEMRKMG